MMLMVRFLPENRKEFARMKFNQLLNIYLVSIRMLICGLSIHDSPNMPSDAAGCSFSPWLLHRRRFSAFGRTALADNPAGKFCPRVLHRVAVFVAVVCPSIRSWSCAIKSEQNPVNAPEWLPQQYGP